MMVMIDCAPEQLREGEHLVIRKVERDNQAIWLSVACDFRSRHLARRQPADPAGRRRPDRGDDEGRLVWARIRRAIEAMRAPPAGRAN
jgi:hypothetical protein